MIVIVFIITKWSAPYQNCNKLYTTFNNNNIYDISQKTEVNLPSVAVKQLGEANNHKSVIGITNISKTTKNTHPKNLNLDA